MNLMVESLLFGLFIGIILAAFVCLIALRKTRRKLLELSERASIAAYLKEDLQTTRQLLEEKRQENALLTGKNAGLLAEKNKSIEFFNQRISDLSAVHQSMKEAFAALSNDAVVKNADFVSTSFKQAMEHFLAASEKERTQSQEQLFSIMKPLRESLLLVDKKVGELESSRQGAYAGLKEQIEGLKTSQSGLLRETQHLSRALSAPTIRGRWGEMQLKRVVELSGMSAHCDFLEQKTIKANDDILRPDMIVTLPQNKKIVIDAKAPLEIVTKTADASADKEEQRGADLALSLKRHLMSLKKKSYHSVIGDSPEFVVMFLPSEALLHWALLADPMLLDFAAQNEVIIATPVTLVALLKAIAFGFRQESIANNIEEVRKLSKELIDRVETMSSHFEKLGRSLKLATDTYNQTLASLDSRVLVTARKLVEIRSLAHDADEQKMSPKKLEVILREPKDSKCETGA